MEEVEINSFLTILVVLMRILRSLQKMQNNFKILNNKGLYLQNISKKIMNNYSIIIKIILIYYKINKKIILQAIHKNINKIIITIKILNICIKIINSQEIIHLL